MYPALLLFQTFARFHAEKDASMDEEFLLIAYVAHKIQGIIQTGFHKLSSGDQQMKAAYTQRRY